MITKTGLFCTCAVFLFLVSESWSAPKNKLMARNWGPQSMLYLKGRHGRFVSDYEDDFHKQSMNAWNAILKSWKTPSPRILKKEVLRPYLHSLYRLPLGYESSLIEKLVNLKRRQLAHNMDLLYLE